MSLGLFLLHGIWSTWEQLRRSWALDAARRKKLETLFQPGAKVTSRRSGTQYTVRCAEHCYAILVSKQGRTVIVDWLRPSGAENLAVADNWEPSALPLERP